MSEETDDPSPPSWINKEFLEEILNIKSHSKISVSKFIISSAVGKGDNYASLLLRVNVEYEQEGVGSTRASLIIKSLPDRDIRQGSVKDNGAFERENKIYLEIIPAMLNLMKRKLSQDTEEMFVPVAFPCERPYTLVLEDLREKGYRMTNRFSGLDLKHSLLVVRKLAKFHAASVALHCEDPSKLEGFKEVIWNEKNREMIELCVPNTLNILANYVEGWEGFEKYSNKLRELGRKCIDTIIEIVKPSKTFLSVLNHGDCWVNNCMFKYNEATGEPESMTFVDLQVARYSSPTLDLLFLLYTSVQREVRSTNYKQILMEYHTVMNDTLEALGCSDKRFSMDELEEDIKLREMFGLYAACFILCVVVADPEDVIDMESFTEEERNSGKANCMQNAMNGRRYREELQFLLPVFESKGLL